MVTLCFPSSIQFAGAVGLSNCPGAPRLALVGLAALALAGCGRRGPLELPPGAPAVQSNAASNRIVDDQSPPGLIQSPNRVIERTAAEKEQHRMSKMISKMVTMI